MRGWVIDRDYIEAGRVGYGMTAVEAEATQESFDGVIGRQVYVGTGLRSSDVEDAVRFRALDDDDEVYYGGAVTASWVTGDDEDETAFTIDRFVEADAGATTVQFRAQDLPDEFVETHRRIGATREAGGTEWVVVFS